jgi:hypothetical protein
LQTDKSCKYFMILYKSLILYFRIFKKHSTMWWRVDCTIYSAAATLSTAIWRQHSASQWRNFCEPVKIIQFCFWVDVYVSMITKVFCLMFSLQGLVMYFQNDVITSLIKKISVVRSLRIRIQLLSGSGSSVPNQCGSC